MTKSAKGQRRDLARLEDTGTRDGPKMLALKTDQQREFVRALYQVRQGRGMAVRAAKVVGYGTATSSAQSMATISSRLMNDERILEAIHEEGAKHIRGIAPAAIIAAARMINNDRHKDHARSVALILERVHPLETTHTVKVEHSVTPDFKETAQVHARIAELTAKFKVQLPAPAVRVIDGEFSEVKSRAVK